MSKTVGIDLGTTNSCVAVMEGGETKIKMDTASTKLKELKAADLKHWESAKDEMTNAIEEIKTLFG